MIGLDTNALARYMVRDDPQQTRLATDLIESRCTPDDPGVVSLVVLCELVWAFCRGYGYDRKSIAGVLRRLLLARDLQVEHADIAWQALNAFEVEAADFSDFVIALRGRHLGARVTYTFDRRAGQCDLFELVGKKM